MVKIREEAFRLFIDGQIAISCKNEKEMKDFYELLTAKKITWSSGGLLNNSHEDFIMFGNKTAFFYTPKGVIMNEITQLMARDFIIFNLNELL